MSRDVARVDLRFLRFLRFGHGFHKRVRVRCDLDGDGKGYHPCYSQTTAHTSSTLSILSKPWFKPLVQHIILI